MKLCKKQKILASRLQRPGMTSSLKKLLADCFKTVADGPKTGLLAVRAISNAHICINTNGKMCSNPLVQRNSMIFSKKRTFDFSKIVENFWFLIFSTHNKQWWISSWAQFNLQSLENKTGVPWWFATYNVEFEAAVLESTWSSGESSF